MWLWLYVLLTRFTRNWKKTSLKTGGTYVVVETKEFQKGYKTKIGLEAMTVQIIRLLSMNFWWIVCAVTIILSSYFA